MTTTLKNTTITGTGHLTLPVGTTSQRPPINTTTIRWTNTGTQSYSVLSGSTPTLSATSWTAPAGVTNVEVLVLAGGGSGGNAQLNSGTPGGGGGAGGLVYNSNYSVTPGQTYAISVGAGGAAVSSMGASPIGGKGRQGSNSLFGTGTSLVTNGDFSSATGWAAGTNINIGSGVATFASPSHGTNLQQTATSFTAGVTYTIAFTVTSYTSGAITIYGNYSTGTTFLIAASIGFSTGDFSYQFTPTTSGTGFSLQADGVSAGACSLTIDNVSIYASTSNIVAIGGGGGGGGYSPNGLPGGSGGGSCGGVGGAAIPGQGYAGGTFRIRASGGGGAGGTGGGDLDTASNQILAGGGNGLNFSITGTPNWYAGGGACGASISSTTIPAPGGIGGGGAGAVHTDASGGVAGAASYGGGGGGGAARGGSSSPSGAGGSGVVVLRYSSLASGNTTTGLVRYNTDLRDIELYEGVGTGWQTQDTARNFSLHNVVSYSEQANLWSIVNASVSANSIANPLDGVSTADKLVEASDTGQAHYMLQYFDVPARSIWCASVYVKAVGRTNFRIGFSNYSTWAGGNGNETRFNLSTGVASPVSPATPLAYGMIDAGNGWYRCYTVGQNATDYAIGSNFVIYLEDGSQSSTYNGDGTSGIYVYGMQMESDVLFPSTYTKTDSIKMPRPTSLGGYRTHTYTTVGTTSFTPAVSGTVEVLVVAGGGAGGNNHAGGGGGGGLVYKTNYPVISGRSYPVTVGAGGVAAGSGASNNTNGGNSGFGTIIAVGGGAGGNRNDSANTSPGQSGGSGGGGGGAQGIYPNNYAAGTGTVGQGNSGGIAINVLGGGGGGAGSPGIDGGGATGVGSFGGEGGNGLQFSISGTPTYYAGGGGGSSGGLPVAAGGLGGGGEAGAAVGSSGVAGTNGLGGGGGGGGAGNTTGSNGGSGIVIVRYRYS